MDILLDNPLATMYGPYFLILYGFVTLFTILFLALAKSSVDKSDRLAVPSIPSKLDPYEMAYLRGGINEMARTAVFALGKKGLLEIRADGKKSVIDRTPGAERVETTIVEDAALSWFRIPRQPNAVFGGGGLTEALEPYADEYLRRLGNQQLISGTHMQGRLSALKWPAYLIVIGLGAYKALAAIANGRFNLIGLLVIGIIGIVGITLVARLPWLTKLGKAYLERLRTAFDGLRYQPAEKQTENERPAPSAVGSPLGVDPLLLSVGIFGSGVLVGTAYGAYDDVFAKAQRYQASTDGGAGAGCGSCSSGSGGSSCSSGGSSCGSSGCGGGCGGCGGS